MDFERSPDQLAIQEAVAALLSQYAGPARAIALAAKDGYDRELHQALAEGGFLDLAREPGAGFLDAALLVEDVARHAGVVAAGASALVMPALFAADAPPGPAALADDPAGPVRYGAQAATLVWTRGDEARFIALEPGRAEPLRTSFGYPMGRWSDAARDAGQGLGPGSAAVLRRFWRVALAAEAVGTMAAALDLTVAYLKQRRQFGRAIGSFQAVQHRLAECSVWVEGAAWLVREAAAQGAPEQAATVASAHALAAAGRVFNETHQLSGAIGYTREHDLHVFSMRLQALRLELAGSAAHRRAAARARWAAPA